MVWYAIWPIPFSDLSIFARKFTLWSIMDSPAKSLALMKSPACCFSFLAREDRWPMFLHCCVSLKANGWKDLIFCLELFENHQKNLTSYIYIYIIYIDSLFVMDFQNWKKNINKFKCNWWWKPALNMGKFKGFYPSDGYNIDPGEQYRPRRILSWAIYTRHIPGIYCC